MKKLVILILLIAFHKTLNAQYSSVDWLLTINTAKSNIVDLEFDDQGSTIGIFTYQSFSKQQSSFFLSQYEITLPVPHYVNSVIFKVNQKGDLLWHKVLVSDKGNTISDVHISQNGNILIAGISEGFKEQNSSKKDSKSLSFKDGGYLVALSATGKLLWENNYKGDKSTATFFNSGYISTNTQNEIFFSSVIGVPVTKSRKASIRKLNQNGRELSSFFDHQLEGIFTRIYDCPKLKVDGNDELIVYGTVFIDKSIGTTPKNANNDLAYGYIMKYDQALELLWETQIGGRGLQFVTDLAIDQDNAIQITGNYNYECAIGQGISQINSNDFKFKSGTNFFYFRLKGNGQTEFAKFYSGEEDYDYFRGLGISIDDSGYTHIAGAYNGEVDINDQRIFKATHLPSGGSTEKSGFYSLWQKDSLIALRGFKEFTLPQFIETHQGHMITAGRYRNEGGLTNDEIDIRFPNYTEINGSSTITSFVLSGKLSALPGSSDSSTNEQEQAEDLITETTNDTFAENDESHVTLFPNPADNEVNLKLSGLKGFVRIDIMSQSGQLIYTLSKRLEQNSEQVSLNIATLASGIYNVLVSGRRFNKALRLIVK